ncbi:MAG: ceramidase domain-containing protein [Rickettsiales bacterium]
MEPTLSHLYGVCERHAEGMLAEPLNVISNIGFLYVAVAIYRYYHKHEDVMGRWIWDIHALTFLTFFIGVNSIIFHAYPTTTTELMDTIPIVLFIIIYFISVIFRIGRTTLFQGIVCLVAFVGFSHVLVHQFPRALNDSIGYLSSMIALVIIAVYLNMKRRPSANQFMLAAIIGITSLFCRAIDREVCGMFPLGTHFLWHSLNATLLYILLKQIVRNVNREARLKRMAGDSSAI